MWSSHTTFYLSFLLAYWFIEAVRNEKPVENYKLWSDTCSMILWEQRKHVSKMISSGCEHVCKRMQMKYTTAFHQSTSQAWGPGVTDSDQGTLGFVGDGQNKILKKGLVY